MTRDPLSNALQDMATRYEASYSVAGAHADPTLLSRARRRRFGTITAFSALSLGLIVGSSAAAAHILGMDRGHTTEPVAPPIPEGYERVVISIPDESGRISLGKTMDPQLDAAGLYDEACDVPLPDLGDSEPFSLEITSTSTESEIDYGDTDVSDIEVTASLSYVGNASGAVRTDRSAWVLLDDDGMIVQSVGRYVSADQTLAFRDEHSHSLGEAFTTTATGWIPPLDCVKSTTDANGYPDPGWEGWFLDPGQYSVVAIVPVEWSPVASVILEAESLGLYPEWFGEDWRDAIPCPDAVADAHRNQDGNVIECVPNLYYRHIPHPASTMANAEFLIVDVPSDSLSGPRKTWYVVSDPYSFEWTGEGVQPAA